MESLIRFLGRDSVRPCQPSVRWVLTPCVRVRCKRIGKRDKDVNKMAALDYTSHICWVFVHVTVCLPLLLTLYAKLN